jgi:hypothetical protein
VSQFHFTINGQPVLVTAAWMCIVAALLHFGCILGGPDWYRFLGAGEDIARAAERGAWMPSILAFSIGSILLVWAAYAFSGAGFVDRLPLLRTALVLITTVLLLRALAYFVRDQWRPDLSQEFMMWSSLIGLLLGVFFAMGTWQAWAGLSTKEPI